MASLVDAAKLLQGFEEGSLTNRISTIETKFRGLDKNLCRTTSIAEAIEPNLLDAALILKKTAGQINALIHTVGIILSLPSILQEGEYVETLSLGAGNTGRPFDLETNHRVAEFKFISWKGGSESIRQNSLFKDLYMLAEYPTPKVRYLYVIDTKYPLKFLNGHRALSSVMSRNAKLWTDFVNRYGSRFSRVHEYYEHQKTNVHLVDLREILSQFNSEIGMDIFFGEEITL